MAPNGDGEGACNEKVYVIVYLIPHLGKVALAALEGGRSTVCVVDGEEKLAQVYKEVTDVEDK